MQTQRFAVEFDRRVVGIAVQVPGGFMFFASHDDFEALDGRLFPRARAIARELEKHCKPSRRSARPTARRGTRVEAVRNGTALQEYAP